MEFVYNDGGAEKHGYTNKVTTGGCFVRAVAIANYYHYPLAWKLVEMTCYSREWCSPGGGVDHDIGETLIEGLGWKKESSSGFKLKDLPYTVYCNEVIMLQFDDHMSVMKNGVLHDVHRCKDLGLQSVWVKEKKGLTYV